MFKPAACPNEVEVSRACNAYSDQELHLYQVLFLEGLTLPANSGILGFERVKMSPILRVFLRLQPTLGFEVFPPRDTVETILEKATLLLEAGEKERTLPYSCCSLAAPKSCVCSYSYHCPLHGDMCVGSHD